MPMALRDDTGCERPACGAALGGTAMTSEAATLLLGSGWESRPMCEQTDRTSCHIADHRCTQDSRWNSAYRAKRYMNLYARRWTCLCVSRRIMCHNLRVANEHDEQDGQK